MGCSVSSPAVGDSNRSPGRPDTFQLSEHDKRIIKRTWQRMQDDMSGMGVKILLRIFTLQPDVKAVFPCRDLEGEELVKDPHFKGHACRLMQAVGAAVDCIDAVEETMAPLLMQLGEQHCQFPGVRPEYFEVFVEASRQIWRQELQEKFKQEVEDAWMQLFVFIMTKLKDGYTGSTPATRHSKSGPRLDRFISI